MVICLHSYSGCCNLPAAQCWNHMVLRVQGSGEQQGKTRHSGLFSQPDHIGTSENTMQMIYSNFD